MRAHNTYMHGNSPPPFIVIRTPRRPVPYERTLELVEHVQKVLDNATARMHLSRTGWTGR